MYDVQVNRMRLLWFGLLVLLFFGVTETWRSAEAGRGVVLDWRPARSWACSVGLYLPGAVVVCFLRPIDTNHSPGQLRCIRLLAVGAMLAACAWRWWMLVA